MDENIITDQVTDTNSSPKEPTPRYVQKSLRFTEAQWARVEEVSALATGKGLTIDLSFTGIVLFSIESAINYLTQPATEAKQTENKLTETPAAEAPVKLLPFGEIVRINLNFNDAQWDRFTKLADYAHNQGLIPDTSINTFLKFALLIAAEDTLKKFWLNDEGFS